ncbi:uncharacterized protein LOC142597308 [Dermatophagoides farinae]|uniref:uncharacterized protein LOC142597308 n=1 Tax=Dermatophagoides farinae TaxID=6954 RepID=UPI003F5FC69E
MSSISQSKMPEFLLMKLKQDLKRANRLKIQNQRHKKENLIPTMNWLTNARNCERGSLHLPIVLNMAPFSPITKTYIIIYARTIQKHLSVHQMKDDDVRDVLLPVNNDGEETKSSSEVDWN